MRETNTKLFDDKPREYSGLSRRAETAYSFLDRTSLPEYARIRQMLERWVDRFPPDHQSKIVSRLRHNGSGSAVENRQFDATFFELYLHEFLIGTGDSVVVEPEINHRTPDFQTIERSADGSTIRYFIEATDIDLERGTELEGQWAELLAIDTLNEISSPKYHLFLRTAGALKASPRKSDLKLPFERLVAEADFETLLLASLRADYNIDEAPSATFTSGEWTAQGALIPVLPEFHDDAADFVGIWSKGGRPYRRHWQDKKPVIR